MISPRIARLKERMLSEKRYLSVEQAEIITESYRVHANEPRILQRAHALAASLNTISIRIDPDELIVGNRSVGIRAGVVFPEAGISWLNNELDSLPTRAQDPFNVHPDDAEYFRNVLMPQWAGRSLEDLVEKDLGDEIRRVKKVIKINQTDHAQGHICPNVELWLQKGPAGLMADARLAVAGASADGQIFLEAVIIVLQAAEDFMRRYAALAASDQDPETRKLHEICSGLARRPPLNFHEALQSLWFLFVILQMESNASSFSPGRMDQYLLPYLEKDLDSGRLDEAQAEELLAALWLKFNQIVYMRSASSARYFAGFPIGFTVSIGGIDSSGRDAVNRLSWMCLKVQEQIGLTQPNLTARVGETSSDEFLHACARVIGRGGGMPQIVNDKSIIPSLMDRGISLKDARNYAAVGCVELGSSGNSLGWSDAAMFNLVKALELAINDGICLQTGKRLGPATGLLTDFADFDAVLDSFRRQIDYFFDAMIPLCDVVDKLHAELLPSPFLSSVVDDCILRARDVTAGGAGYNLSGIQAIQVANVADSLAALKALVFDSPVVFAGELLQALRHNFEGHEHLRQILIHKAPKYGNDVEWVDNLGAQWISYFAGKLAGYRNARGGPYHMGLYTVSAHIPMGFNVGASPDGRKSGDALADGGMSAASGRDRCGPTALLRSVARVGCRLASNGTLLNMKFLPGMFRKPEEREKFIAMLKAFIVLGIHHIQFNVIDRQTLLDAKAKPENFAHLTIRVAGYSARFVELADDLQEEIIARTTCEL